MGKAAAKATETAQAAGTAQPLRITEVPGTAGAGPELVTAPVPLVRQRMTLYEITRESHLIEEALIASDGELTPELEVRFDELLVQGPQRIEAAIAIVRELQASAKAADDEAKRMAARKKSFERNADVLKERIRIALDEAFNGRIKGARYTAWTQETKASVGVSFEGAPDLLEHLYATRKDLVAPSVTFELSKDAVLALWAAEAPQREQISQDALAHEEACLAAIVAGEPLPPPMPSSNFASAIPAVISVVEVPGRRFLQVR